MRCHNIQQSICPLDVCIIIAVALILSPKLTSPVSCTTKQNSFQFSYITLNIHLPLDSKISGYISTRLFKFLSYFVQNQLMAKSVILSQFLNLQDVRTVCTTYATMISAKPHFLNSFVCRIPYQITTHPSHLLWS
jgi:hypothetical protein